MSNIIKIKKGITGGVVPTGLTFGELAVNITDKFLYVGGVTGNSIQISGSPQYLDGLVDVVLTSPSPNQILSFNGTNWVNSSAANFFAEEGDVVISGDLIVSGRIVTSTGVFGATGNATIEPVSDMIMDGGSF